MPTIPEHDWPVLHRIPLFAGLSPDALNALLASAKVSTYAPDTVLFMQDDPADRFFAILSGWVKLWRETPSGEETVLAVFTRGDTFAEAAMFDSGRYPVNAEVVEESRILVIPARPFLSVVSTNSAIALRMLGSMSRHMRGLVAQLEQVQAKSAPQRIASFLLRQDHKDSGPVSVKLPYDKFLIAARLGMRPETFSRALSKLRPLGVQATGSVVVIDDPVELRRFAEEDAPSPH